jgi:hypothetical protein
LHPFPFVFVALLTFPPQSPDVPLDELLANAERYVVEYEPQLSHCVAREEYVQLVSLPIRRSRTLRSDFLFLRSPEVDSWIGVRSVYEVNGRPVSNRDDNRLREIAAASPSDAAKLAEAVAKENAQYNLGIDRTVNVPNLLLGWLRAEVRHRLRFRRRGLETIGGVSVRRIDFEETRQPTLIQSHGEDLVSSGSIWVEQASGRVWQTELRNGTKAATFMMRVRYEFEPRLGILVPIKLEEAVTGAILQRGDATYSNYRRFGTSTRIK